MATVHMATVVVPITCTENVAAPEERREAGRVLDDGARQRLRQFGLNRNATTIICLTTVLEETTTASLIALRLISGEQKKLMRDITKIRRVLHLSRRRRSFVQCQQPQPAMGRAGILVVLTTATADGGNSRHRASQHSRSGTIHARGRFDRAGSFG